VEKRTSIGLTGNIERVEYSAEDREDWIWGVVGTLSHTPLKWLTIALEISHRELNSNIETNDYDENRGMIKITATY
jgi:rRNA maturation endonuclease Nob1